MTFSNILKREDRFDKLGLELLSPADKNIYLWTWCVAPEFQVDQTRTLSWRFSKTVLAAFTIQLSGWTVFSVVMSTSWNVQGYPHLEKPVLSVWLLAAVHVCFALFLNASGFLAVSNITDAELIYKQEAILPLSLLSGVLLLENYHRGVRLLPITVKTQSFGCSIQKLPV